MSNEAAKDRQRADAESFRKLVSLFENDGFVNFYNNEAGDVVLKYGYEKFYIAESVPEAIDKAFKSLTQ